MATYREIQAWIKKQHGFVPKTCWIAHVMSDYNLTTRQASNRMNAAFRREPCPKKETGNNRGLKALQNVCSVNSRRPPIFFAARRVDFLP